MTIERKLLLGWILIGAPAVLLLSFLGGFSLILFIMLGIVWSWGIYGLIWATGLSGQTKITVERQE